MSSEVKELRHFGKFRLDVQKKVLWHDGQPVDLPLKEIELLCVLTENRGDVVTKDELLERVWSDSFVEESNLSRQIYLLRKTFKDFGENEEWIQTVRRRGYRFAGDVKDGGKGGLIIEKHTLTQTVVEEINPGETAIEGNRLSLQNLTAVTSINLRRLLPRPRLMIPAALLLAIALIAITLLRHDTTNVPRVSAIKSIAVLPLSTFAENSDDKALGFGFADALITSLGKVTEVRVMSINAVSRYAVLQKEPLEIAKDLGVDSIFDGTMQRANGKIRVTLRLSRTSDGKQIWSGSFDENESDIFHLQDAMAMRTSQALALNLGPKDAKRPTENRDAYQAYLRGRFFFDQRTSEAYERAAAEFERAITLDLNYALPYAGLADVFAMQANNADGQKSDALYQESTTMAMKALELDESSAEAHASLGWVKRIHDWDWPGSEREFKRALELDPKCVKAHQWYSLLLITLGRADEALAEIEQARELEPLSQIVLRNYFMVRQYRRESELLPALAEQIVRLDNTESVRNRIPLIAYSRTRNYAKVIELGEASPPSQEGAMLPHYMAIAYARTGQQAKAKKLLDYFNQRARKESESAYRLAMVYGELGRKDEAIALLQKCFAAKDDRLVWLILEPHFDSLRSDPRFQEILRRMHLPDVQ